jgi:hypothetical protein
MLVVVLFAALTTGAAPARLDLIAGTSFRVPHDLDLVAHHTPPAPAPPAPKPAPKLSPVVHVNKHLPSVPVVRASVVAIGDSVMQGASSALHARIRSLYVDTRVGRQVSEGIQVLARLRAAHRLGQVVVIHLGTNGSFTAAQFDQIMRILAGVKRVVFVNLKVPRKWESSDNKTIAAGVARYRGKAVLVNWHSTWHSCPGTVFAHDGYHLTSAGAKCYSAYIASAI